MANSQSLKQVLPTLAVRGRHIGWKDHTQPYGPQGRSRAAHLLRAKVSKRSFGAEGHCFGRITVTEAQKVLLTLDSGS